MNFDPKNRQHLLIFVAAAVVGLFLGDRLVLTPLLNSWKARSVRLAEMKKKVNDGEMLLKRGDALASRWAEWQTNSLPPLASEADSRMSAAFDRWTQASGVSMTSYRPTWKRPGDDYMTLECRADISGRLQDITRFIYELEHDPLGVKIDSATLATRDSDGAQITLALQVSGLQLIPIAR
jgi:hypothetical protein